MREASGQGIQFGNELETSEWGEVLDNLQKPGLRSNTTTYVCYSAGDQVSGGRLVLG